MDSGVTKSYLLRKVNEEMSSVWMGGGVGWGGVGRVGEAQEVFNLTYPA